jgi:hypothetical protein
MEKQKKSLAVKIILGVVALIVCSIVGLSIWLFRPLKEVPPGELLPETTFSFFSLSLNIHDPFLSELMTMAKEQIVDTDNSKIKKRLVNRAFSWALPRQVVGIVILEDGTDEPELLFVTSMGKIVRLAKLFNRFFDRALFQGEKVEKVRVGGHTFKSVVKTAEERSPSAYSIIANNIVIGTTLSSVQASYKRYYENESVDPYCKYLSGVLFQASAQKDVFLYVDNNDGKLSRVIQKKEEEYAFAAFPSVDSVTTIDGYIGLLPESVEGTLKFYCKDTGRIDDVRSDVKFIYGAMRRKFRASDIKLKGDIQIEDNNVKFSFHIPGIMEIISGKFIFSGGDE